MKRWLRSLLNRTLLRKPRITGHVIVMFHKVKPQADDPPLTAEDFNRMLEQISKAKGAAK